MKLFEKTKLGQIELSNRMVMAPLTRSRAIGNVPNQLMVQYYEQRASAGLIITEGTSPSPNGLGYARIPGLFNQAQVAGWRDVTQAVHKKGGRIFVQLMHTGRVSHPMNLPKDATIVAPSALPLSGKMWTDEQGLQDYPIAKEMSEQEILAAIAEYAHSAELAIQAGFDGVELHGANGYLIEQFLNPAANHRSDRWGGSNDGRMRFGLEVAKAVVAKVGGQRTGIRVSPYGVFNDTGAFEGVDAFFAEFAQKLSDLGLVYIHVVDHSAMGAPAVSADLKRTLRQKFKGTYILSGGYDAKRAEGDLQESKGDLVAFGRPFISNSDLVQKLQTGAALKDPDPTKFYTAGSEGYTDY